MNIHDDPTNVENQSADAEDPELECCEEMQGQKDWDHIQSFLLIWN